MKATLPWLAAVFAAALAAPAARAQYGCPCRPMAPYTYGPAYYAPNAYGAYYGPNYYVYPGSTPFNGMVIGPNAPRGYGPGGPGGPGGQGVLGSPSFPTHPYARSPRDFFMVD